MIGSLRAALIVPAALLAICAASASAHTTTYAYSYTFDTSDTATGTFTAAGPITALIDISNVTLKIDGTTISGVTAYSYTGYAGTTGMNCDTCYTNSGATVSSNPLNENFLFSNGSKYFYIIPWNNGPGNQVATQAVGPGGTIDNYNGSYIPANFSVVAVPEASTWIMMLAGFGVAGAALRRRVQATAA